MGQPPDAKLTLQMARDLCQRTQSAAVLNGSIASLGSQFVLGLQAKDGLEPMSERALRCIANLPNWQDQRLAWRAAGIDSRL